MTAIACNVLKTSLWLSKKLNNNLNILLRIQNIVFYCALLIPPEAFTDVGHDGFLKESLMIIRAFTIEDTQQHFYKSGLQVTWEQLQSNFTIAARKFKFSNLICLIALGTVCYKIVEQI